MKLFTDQDLRRYVADEIKMALEADRERQNSQLAATAHACELEKKRALEEKDWEIRRLTSQLQDMTAQKDRFRGGYKRLLSKTAKMRETLGKAKRQLAASGLAGDSEPNEDGTPKLDNIQAIFDGAMSEIPAMDDMSQKAVRSYIERELRARGAKAGPEILEEVLAGDTED